MAGAAAGEVGAAVAEAEGLVEVAAAVPGVVEVEAVVLVEVAAVEVAEVEDHPRL